MSNGRLLSPSAVRVKSVPRPWKAPKSIEWTFCPEEASVPRGTVRPWATVRPPASFSCQGSGVVVAVTRVAFFGPAGR